MTTAFGLGFFGVVSLGPIGVVWLLFCCFLPVLLFFPTPSLHPHIFCTFEYNNAHFHKTFTPQHFITEGLQRVPYSFFSHTNLSETAELFWECDRYYSPAPLFFTDFFFFNHLFHFAANSTFVPWTNSITMTQPTAHSGLPCVSSHPLKPAQSPCWMQRARFQLWAHNPEVPMKAAVPHRATHVSPCTSQCQSFLPPLSLKRHFL